MHISSTKKLKKVATDLGIASKFKTIHKPTIILINSKHEHYLFNNPNNYLFKYCLLLNDYDETSEVKDLIKLLFINSNDDYLDKMIATSEIMNYPLFLTLFLNDETKMNHNEEFYQCYFNGIEEFAKKNSCSYKFIFYQV